MESSLKRIVDYKLLYDSLADPSNGMIQVATLTARWPKDLAASIKLPRGLPEKWRVAADDNGFLDWEKFSSALKKALEEDKPRLLSSDGSQTPPNFGMEEKMSNFQQRKVGAQAPRVRAEEIELFLSRCKGDILAQALSRTRKEVYKCQMSLHQLESASNRAAAASSTSSGKVAQPKQSDPSSTNVKVPLVNALSNVGQEKEELLKGMEVMEITRLWFNSRLEQLALEQKQPTKMLKPEELLAALDRREEQPMSETLKHIQEINSHLGKLAKEAPGLSLEQLKKQYHHQQQQRKQNIKAVASDPGPFSQSKSAGQRGGGPVKATTTTMKMNFPAYSPPSNVHVSPSRVSSPPVRSSSMREFHTVRGEMKEEGSHGAPMARPSTTHRSVSMSTQSLTDNQRHGDNQAYYYQQHHHVSNKPRRSQSFNEKSMSSSPGSSGGGGSLVQQSGLSSSSASSTGSSGTSTLEYPSKASSHSHSHSGYRTYPLRETSSLQTLPSSASSSYGGNAAASTKSSHGMDGHLHHQNKHGSHHGGHHGQIRSSSVRNIPSASGYNNSITMTTTTATTAAVSSASSSSLSSSGSSQQSGRPIFSQPMSASSGRVESVDIPSHGQPQQLSNTSASTAMATNVRHSTDLSSSYPGHHHGYGHGHSRAGHGSSSSSTRGTSGQIQHGHGGSRGSSGGENPKQSRRHLHKAVQEQSLRIKQLEAENTVLTRERGSYVSSRGQKQQHKATAAAGHPVIKTSALQSVV